MDRQRAGSNEWTPTTEAMFEDQLNAVPPRLYFRNGFLVGEAFTDGPRGPLYAGFRKTLEGYEARFMTVEEAHTCLP